MVNWPKALIREISERRVVFFIGSGISKAAHNAFPTWAKLLEELSVNIEKKKDQNLVKRLIGQDKMLDAAQIIRDGMPRADLNSLLRSTFQLRPTPVNSIYRDVLLMDPKTMITTNYDELLERNLEHFSNGTEAHSICKQNMDNLITDLRSPIRSIVKLHGCITEPSELVLDRASYFHTRRKNPGLFNTISSLMTVNTVVFLGYSISDPDIQLTLENINLFAKSDHPHYALLTKFEHSSIKSAMKETYNVEVIEYPAGAHSSVPPAIGELRNSVQEFRASHGIP